MQVDMDNFVKGLLGVFIAIMCLIMYACTVDMKKQAAYQKKCEAAGGVYYKAYKSSAICLDSSDVKSIQ